MTHNTSSPKDMFTRRELMSFLGATANLAGLSLVGCTNAPKLESSDLQDDLSKQLTLKLGHYSHDAQVIIQIDRFAKSSTNWLSFPWGDAYAHYALTQAIYSVMRRHVPWEDIYRAATATIKEDNVAPAFAMAAKWNRTENLVNDYSSVDWLLNMARPVRDSSSRVFILQEIAIALNKHSDAAAAEYAIVLSTLPAKDQLNRLVELIDNFEICDVDPILFFALIPSEMLTPHVRRRLEYHSRYQQADLEFFNTALINDDVRYLIPAVSYAMEGDKANNEFRNALTMRCLERLLKETRPYPFGFNRMLKVISTEHASSMVKALEVFQSMQSSASSLLDVLDCGFGLLSKLTSSQYSLGQNQISAYFYNTSNVVNAHLHDQLYIKLLANCYDPHFPFDKCVFNRTPQVDSITTASCNALAEVLTGTESIHANSLGADWAVALTLSPASILEERIRQAIVKRLFSGKDRERIDALLREHFCCF